MASLLCAQHAGLSINRNLLSIFFIMLFKLTLLRALGLACTSAERNNLILTFLRLLKLSLIPNEFF